MMTTIPMIGGSLPARPAPVTVVRVPNPDSAVARLVCHTVPGDLGAVLAWFKRAEGPPPKTHRERQSFKHPLKGHRAVLADALMVAIPTLPAVRDRPYFYDSMGTGRLLREWTVYPHSAAYPRMVPYSILTPEDWAALLIFIGITNLPKTVMDFESGGTLWSRPPAADRVTTRDYPQARLWLLRRGYLPYLNRLDPETP